MTSIAKFYIVSIIVLGAALATLFLLADWGIAEPKWFLTLLLLCCFASIMKVKLPTVCGNISVSFVFFMIGTAEMNLADTLVLGFVATLLQCLWRPKNRPRLIQVLFNIAVVELGIITAYQIPRMFSLPVNSSAALAVSACSFFIANSGLVAIVISLVEHRNLELVFRSFYLWTFPYYVIGAGIAGAITSSADEGWKALLVLPLLYLAFYYYRLCVDRMRQSNKQPA